MTMSSESRHISIRIDRPATAVYEYAAHPTNLPNWAAGLVDTPLQQIEGEWAADSPMGRITVRFAEHNDFGVLDHTVTLPSGESVYNPLRVIPDGGSSEVVFTLRRRPGMSEEDFNDDADAVAADLAALKSRCEAR